MKRPALAAEQLKPLYERGNLRNGLDVLLTFTTASALLTAFALYPRPWVGAICFVLVAGVQHRLSLLLHEGTHYLLFTSRFVNDLALRLTAWPVFFTVDYRQVHLAHHKLLGTDEDPDAHNYLSYPRTRSGFFLDLLFHLSGLGAAMQFLGAKGDPLPLRIRLGRACMLGCHGLLAAGLWHVGYLHVYVFVWVLPLVTLTKTLTHFRTVAEHTLLRDVGDPELSRYRTIHCGLIERFFFAPMRFGYHAEHHFYPGIPYHRLPEAHRLLAADPGYADVVDIRRGYTRFLLTQAVQS